MPRLHLQFTKFRTEVHKLRSSGFPGLTGSKVEDGSRLYCNIEQTATLCNTKTQWYSGHIIPDLY
jgi:hypothetical protein